MTELKWINFSGLMRQCLYNCDHQVCPFNEYRQMDHIQQFQSLLVISETKSEDMLNRCDYVRSQMGSQSQRSIVHH